MIVVFNQDGSYTKYVDFNSLVDDQEEEIRRYLEFKDSLKSEEDNVEILSSKKERESKEFLDKLIKLSNEMLGIEPQKGSDFDVDKKKIYAPTEKMGEYRRIWLEFCGVQDKL